MMHYSYSDIREKVSLPIGSLPMSTVTARVELSKGDSAWNPSTTKKVLKGEGLIQYHFFPDGGIEWDSDGRVFESWA
ncbi:hypothetical protein ADL27_32555 [Streptomyces sp. NRRL F-6602]|nr:hypothetical protein ADL27_32555 [Streptomyces sp. NRRL F-6602]